MGRVGSEPTLAERSIQPAARRVRLVKALLVVAAALSLGAAVIHYYYIEEHSLEWWGYGLFFALLTAAQAFYAFLLLRRAGPWLYWIGIVGTVGVLVVYLVTRTIGVLLGPDSNMVEQVQAPDLIAALLEAMLVAVLGVLLLVPIPGRSGIAASRSREEAPSETSRAREVDTYPVETT